MSKFTSFVATGLSIEPNSNLIAKLKFFLKDHGKNLRVLLKMFRFYYAWDRHWLRKCTRSICILLLTVLRILGLSSLYSGKLRKGSFFFFFPLIYEQRSIKKLPAWLCSIFFFSSFQVLPELPGLFKNNIHYLYIR